MANYDLPRTSFHTKWNRALAPALEVESGATVTFGVTESSDGQLHAGSTAADVAAMDFGRINPVTGPILVRGAQPGDTLVAEILAIEAEDWGWTANIPGFGLLADEFTEPHLRISRVRAGRAEILPGIAVPAVPFIGTIGVAMPEPGAHSVVPPSRYGGNMDIRHMCAGARVRLPIAVPGALFSLGDTHAAQGDGEVGGTAIECGALVTVRFGLERGGAPAFPVLETHPRAARAGRAVATTGIGPDLFEAARQATAGMIEEIVRRTGLDELDAYLLASVAGDLKISEIVDQPNWVVSMHLETAVLEGGV